MIRLLLILLGTLSSGSPAGRVTPASPGWPSGNGSRPGQAGPGGTAMLAPALSDAGEETAEGYGRSSGRRRRWWQRRVTWIAAAALVVLVFRRAIASVMLVALSATLHLLGMNAALPSVRFGWPWQAAGPAATNTSLGPWVLQKIEGISRPALGQANFTFVFTHRVSKSVGPWPCWYASTFYAVGHASATVNLNPGPSWWAASAGHYRLQVLSRPGGGRPGQVAVTMMLPRPQLPRSVHDVSIDNLPSRPVSTQHSWTYPGFGCGVLLRPQFSPSVLYADAQRLAFQKATSSPQITGPLIQAAEVTATRTIRDSFLQPTLGALGYSLREFTLRWAGPAGQ